MPIGTPTKGEANARIAGSDKPTAAAVDLQTLIDGLNQDLVDEYQTVVMYTQYSAKLTGPYCRELRVLFQAEIADEQGHAEFLADKIASLGGEPTTEPRADRPREMLEQAISDYDARHDQPDAVGDGGLKVSLETQIADETRHKEEFERVLAGWDER